MNNILIFGLPRTATTALQVELSVQLSLKSLKEPFCGDAVSKDVNTWVKTQKNCVMKLLTTNLWQQHTEKIDIIQLLDSGISHLVVTQRKNLVDCCISLYYAERIANQYHYAPTDSIKRVEFEVDEDFVNNWLIEIDMYYQVLAQLSLNQVKYDVFDYDAYIEKHPQNIVGCIIGPKQQHHYVHDNIDYAELCSNYNEVKTKIEDHAKRLQS